MKPTFTLAALIALGAAASLPLPSMAQSSFSFVISSGPPAPLYERAPMPRRGYIWSPGHWEWRGHRHQWVGGYWVAERPGYAYVAPSWQARRDGWYFEPSRWQAYPAQSYYGRDRDRDGIPDRFERHGHGHDRWEARRERERWERRHDVDRDGIPNRYDRDRDGDGVPNRYDRAPDNWRHR